MAATGEPNPFGSLWCVHFTRGGRRWAVAGRFAIEALGRARVGLEKLGLEPGRQYAAYDFWAGRYLGVVTGTVGFKALEMGRCQALALHAAGETPFVLASSRHVSMDVVGVLQEQYEEGVLSLGLAGVPGRAFEYVIWLPAGFSPIALESTGGTVSLKSGQGVARLRVRFATKEAEVRLRFG
jgi:hypothetical protein